MADLFKHGGLLLVRTDDARTLLYHRFGARSYTGPKLYATGEGGTTPPGGGAGVPDDFTIIGDNGQTYNFNQTQLTHAAGIVAACDTYPGIVERAILAALACAVVESVLYMYANTAVWPESANIPHDRDNNDTSSVGLFQQRPDYGWGTVLECMSVEPSTHSFLGGPDGPRGGSWPLGLYDLDGWQNMPIGNAVQAVQVSAHPERYELVVNVAEELLTRIRAAA